jgi:hypothetical protein
MTVLLLDVAHVVANATDLDEVKSLDALGPDHLATLRLSQDDLAQVYEETVEVVEDNYAMSD